MKELTYDRDFSFSARPTPVPADLRIPWRIAVILVILRNSRSNRASMAKMYVVMESVLSNQANSLLHRIVAKKASLREWTVRVDPALARAVDLLVGERFADLSVVSGRAGAALTSLGLEAARTVESADLLLAEKSVIMSLRQSLTEMFVTELVFRSSAN